MDYPMGNTAKLNLSINAKLLRITKNDTCASKVVGSPHASTKVIWVPTSFVTVLDGPSKVWVPKCA